MKRALATGTVAAAMLLGPAVAAQAAERPHHDTKAQKKAARVLERREARREARAPKPPQDTTTTAAPIRVGSSDKALGKAPSSTRGVVSCGVTGVRAGVGFTVTNGCDQDETVTVSIQSQPGPWHKGLCQAGGCHLLTRYDVVIPAGSTRTITPDTAGGCWVQVDVKWDGRLIKSNHYVKDCTKPKPPLPTPTPRPPIQHSHADGHKKDPKPVAQLAYTGAGDTEAALLAVAALIGFGTTIRVASRKRQS